MSRLTRTVLFLLATSLRAQAGSPPAETPDNLELTRIYSEDQRVRQPRPLESGITRTDADRLAIVKQMMANDQLHTTADYRHAAFILQHSRVSSDFLIAHSLAVICAADGDKTCLWLSTATLDRYLQSIKQPQIYGTQFNWTADSPVTQQPYSSDLITDAIRKKLSVPSLKEQQKQLEDLSAHPPTLLGMPKPAPTPQKQPLPSK